jgi:3',5'-cyclic AMP phosphodiesterase CpdA
VTARVLHVSDLHVGGREASGPVDALHDLVGRMEPEIVLATGDLSHRGRREQLERAAAHLRELGPPVLAVPGNHDIPYTFPARLTRPFAEWERVFGEPEPVHASDSLLLVGLNSVRPWRHQSGGLDETSLERARARLGTAGRALRAVALHHHLAAPPWRAAHKRALSRRGSVLQALAGAGAELVVGGHVHQASIAERREFRAVEGEPARTLVLATAPGLGRPRPRRLGEAQGVNVYESDPATLSVVTFVWDGGSFQEVGRRTFARAGGTSV